MRPELNPVKLALARLKESDFKKRSSTWELRNAETLFVINLQKSQYGLLYFINVGVWLRALGEAAFPRTELCHLHARANGLIPQKWHRIDDLLNLEVAMPNDQRISELHDILVTDLLPVMRACETVQGARAVVHSDYGSRWLVNAEAAQILGFPSTD